MSIELVINNSIAVLTLNNPLKLKALSCDFMSKMSEKLLDIDQRASVLVVGGGKKAFAAGADVSEISSLSYEEAYLKNFIDCKWETVFNVKIPVIAAVSGYALGGGFELALMCDVIIAGRGAVFGFPEVNLGIIPGMGGTQLLTKVVGPKIASEIIMTGDFLSAKRAMELNIVSKVVEDDELMETALVLANKIAKKSTMSTRLIKDAIRLSQNVGLTQGIQTERIMFRSLFSTSFKKNGVDNFLRNKGK
jgi:enoyl-CoA hydratase/carnithine racemase